MTREENALIYFKDLRERKVKDYSLIFDTAPKDSVVYRAVSAEIEIYDIAIKALEQEPSVSENPNNCDLISREEVLENAFKIYTHECGLVEVVGVATIKDLPSVKPQERTGHWEWVQYDYNPKIGNWHCTECRCVVVECVDKNEKGGIPLYKYCPQCGAKMIEPQESEKE